MAAPQAGDRSKRAARHLDRTRRRLRVCAARRSTLMMACRTHRQVKAARRSRCGELPASGTRKAARRVTTVALISNAGILRQHTQGRVFRANSFRERSMQIDKQFHGGQSPVVLTGHGDEASRYSTEISALKASSEDDAPRPSTVAAAAPLMVKTVAGFAA